MFLDKIEHELDFVFFFSCLAFADVEEVFGKSEELVNVVSLRPSNCLVVPFDSPTIIDNVEWKLRHFGR